MLMQPLDARHEVVMGDAVVAPKRKSRMWLGTQRALLHLEGCLIGVAEAPRCVAATLHARTPANAAATNMHLLSLSPHNI